MNMRKILAVAFAGLCLTVFGTPVLRVMPLGDSITNGTGSNDTAGYRGFLWTFLKNAGYNVDFVGSATSNPGIIEGMDINHEGHGGWKIDDRYGSNGKGIYEMLPTWCGMFEAPNVILLHLGTNDSGNDALTNMWRTTEFLDRLHEFEPSAHVIASTLMWRKTAANYARIQAYNSYLTNVVQQQQAKGQKISILDMHAAVPGDDRLEEGQTTYFDDGLHPNAAGYELMANAWLGALQELYPDTNDFDNATIPVAVSATAEATANQLTVTVAFNKSIVPDDLATAANYVVSGATLGTPTILTNSQVATLYYPGDFRGTSFTLTVSGMRAADDGQTAASRTFTLSTPGVVVAGPENHVPASELNKYRLVYDLNVPTNLPHKGWYVQAVPYAVNNAKSVAKGSFTRVAYWFETVRVDNGQHDWVWVSLDAFTDDPGAIGVPTHRTGKWFQKKVTNLRIWSNSASLVHRNGELVDEGNIEFWPMSYSGGQKMNLPNTLGGFDFDDSPASNFNATYGSMQVHDYKARNVVFGLNHFESGGRMEMGVGTNTEGGNADWTQVNKPWNTFKDGSVRLKVYVLDDTAEATPPEFLSASTRMAGTQLVLTFSKPLGTGQDLLSGLKVDGATATHAYLDAADPARVVVRLAQAVTNAISVTAAGLRDNTPRANAMAAAETRAVEGTDLPPAVVKYVPAALREGYDLVYALDIPVEGFRNGVIPYSVARRDYPAAFDRVAYFLELDYSNAYKTNWVWTSFDPWVDDVSKIAVPCAGRGYTNSFDGTFVSNLDVASNVNGIQTGTNLTGGYIEFWYENYGGGNAYNVPNADGSKCDFGDSRSVGVGTFGSMQVHNYEARQTLWAFNKFNNYNSWINIGIGNNTTGTGHPDWTETSGKDYCITNSRCRTLYVMVRKKAPAPTAAPLVSAPQTILDNVDEAKDYSLLYKVNIPAAAKNLNNNLANWLAVHEVNNKSLYEGKTIGRVAYYLELVRKSDGATQWAWTSYDAPTQDMDRLGFITNKLWNVKTRVRNLNVRSNVDGIVQGDDIQTGSIEFFGSSYSRVATQGLPGADASVDSFDWDDKEDTGTWGCLQVANYGVPQMILSISGHMSGNKPSLGIGNCATAKNLDWTQIYNSEDFTARTLYVFVQEGGAPAGTPTPSCEALYAIPEVGGLRFCVAFDKDVPESMLNPEYYVFTGVSAEVARVERSPRDAREAIVTLKTPLAAGTTGWLTVQIPGSDFKSAAVPKQPAFTVPDGATPAELDAVSERGDYELVYKFTPVASGSWVGTIGPAYGVDETRFRDFAFDRAAYALRIRSADGKTNQWAWASMGAFTDDASKLGVACERRQNTWQCYVDDLHVQHGYSGVMEPILTDGTYPRGNIEFFMGNYGGSNAMNIPGASGSVNDFGDSNSNPTTGYTYNCLQVHSYLAKQTVLAVNALGGGYNSNGNGAKMTGNPGVGIGNNVANTHTDWTFIYNAGQYTTRDLYIFVRPVARDAAVAFTRQPESGETVLGVPYVLTAYAPTAARYQWRKDGVAIAGETSATCEVVETRKGTAVYDVIAYDAYGRTVTSATATVTFKTGGTHLILR